MNLVSFPANPVPDAAVTGTIKTPDGVSLRFARWEPPPGRKGTVCLFQGRSEFIQKYFETVRARAPPAPPRVRRRHPRLARTRPVGPGAAQPAQRLCAEFLSISNRSRNVHQRGRSSRLPAAAVAARTVHGCYDSAARRLRRTSLV